MKDDIQRLQELLDQGKGCAVAIMQVALEMRGEDNPTLLHAMRGLCGGVQSRLLCGALTGCACLLSIVDEIAAKNVMIPELVEWFNEKYSEKYAGIDCSDIIEDNPLNKPVRCPDLVKETYGKTKEILEKYGYESFKKDSF